MRTEQRAKTIYEPIYITADGREFTNKTSAERHEKELNGTIKNCNFCSGRGYVNERLINTFDPLVGHERCYVHDNCKECNGKGYLEKMEVWK